MSYIVWSALCSLPDPCFVDICEKIRFFQTFHSFSLTVFHTSTEYTLPRPAAPLQENAVRCATDVDVFCVMRADFWRAAAPFPTFLARLDELRVEKPKVYVGVGHWWYTGWDGMCVMGWDGMGCDV